LVVLDSWALLALLRRETPAERVRSTWEAEGASMSSINLGEALYMETRRVGASRSAKAIRAARAQMTVVDPDWELVSAAAGFKAQGGLSYADAFCVATAQRLDAPVLTGDPEIVALAGEIEVVDLRSA
jgi:PIN domain nuclease of toxin-antitoxin system